MEFCSHIARHFTVTPGEDRIERARLSLAHMGSSVSRIISLPVNARFLPTQPKTPQTWCKLWILPAQFNLPTSCTKPACLLHQVAVSLLTTCNRLVIIRPEQAMRTHPDIGLVIADLLQLVRFWLCRTLRGGL